MDIKITDIPNHQDYEKLFGVLWSEDTFWRRANMEELLELFVELSREAQDHFHESLRWLDKSRISSNQEDSFGGVSVAQQEALKRAWDTKEEAKADMVKSIFRKGVVEHFVSEEYDKAHRIAMGYYALHDPIEQAI